MTNFSLPLLPAPRCRAGESGRLTPSPPAFPGAGSCRCVRGLFPPTPAGRPSPDAIRAPRCRLSAGDRSPRASASGSRSARRARELAGGGSYSAVQRQVVPFLFCRGPGVPLPARCVSHGSRFSDMPRLLGPARRGRGSAGALLLSPLCAGAGQGGAGR